MSNIANSSNNNLFYADSHFIYNDFNLVRLIHGKKYYKSYDRLMADKSPHIEYDEKFKENTQRTKNYASYRKYLEKEYLKNSGLVSNTIERVQPNVDKKTHCLKKQLGTQFWHNIEKSNYLNGEPHMKNTGPIVGPQHTNGKNKRNFRKSNRVFNAGMKYDLII